MIPAPSAELQHSTGSNASSYKDNYTALFLHLYFTCGCNQLCYVWPTENSCFSSYKEGKKQMPTPNSLRANVRLGKVRELMRWLSGQRQLPTQMCRARSLGPARWKERNHFCRLSSVLSAHAHTQRIKLNIEGRK